MTGWRTWRYGVLRRLGRLVTWTAAVTTLGRMPPFVSASAIVVEDGRILVVLDPIRREAVLPGGHLRWRETPKDAAMREVREETGIEIAVERLVTVVAGEEWTGEPGIVRIVYTARLLGGALRSSGEGDACWLRVDDVAESTSRDAALVRLWRERRAPARDAG